MQLFLGLQWAAQIFGMSALFSRELDATWAGDAVLLGWAQGLLNCCWLYRGGTQPIKHLMNLSLMGF